MPRFRSEVAEKMFHEILSTVSVPDFGIKGDGVQDTKRGVCAFVYRSEERKNGTFTTPNWPGLYPRETECHYFFYGQSNERVHIHFSHFDVEGVPP